MKEFSTTTQKICNNIHAKILSVFETDFRKRQRLIPSPIFEINQNTTITKKQSNMSANSTSSSTNFGKFLFGMFSILMLLSGSLKVNAQAALYTATTGSNASLVLDKNGNAIDMSAGTTQLLGVNSTSASSVTNIGFSFYLLGGGTTPYSQFSANTNGAIRLGSTAVGTTVISAAASTPYLIANNILGKTDPTSGKVHYKLHGTAPNRVMVVEWKDVWIANVGASNANLSTYQTRIYEDGTVEYVYGAMYNNNTIAVSSSIAISLGTSAGNIGQFTTISATPAGAASARTVLFSQLRR
jgi:hypothetical protein